MNTQVITEMEQYMISYLDNSQAEYLHKTLLLCLLGKPAQAEQQDFVQLFLAAKRVESCSDKTVYC